MINELEQSWAQLIQKLQHKSSFSDVEIRTIEFLINQMEGMAQSVSGQVEIPDM